MKQPLIVGIPVKNEEEHIGECLRALCDQSIMADTVLLFLNNCVDRTVRICRGFSSVAKLFIVEDTLIGHHASAGEARRRALSCAGQHFPEGIILTTDADSRPPPDWIEKNLKAMKNGADVVCGRVELYVKDAASIRRGLHFDNMRETLLLALLDEIDSIIDPSLTDPWPRHTHDSGASIGLRAGVLGRIGGAPYVRNGEDRALIDRCRTIDLRIRHDPEIIVPVSGRLEGRAMGGMAETIKRRTYRQDELTDAQIEPAIDAYRRSLAKAKFRACWAGPMSPGRLATDLVLKEAFMSSLLESPFFGAAWDAVQACSPVLRRRRVAYVDLASETRLALQLRERVCRGYDLPFLLDIADDHVA